MAGSGIWYMLPISEGSALLVCPWSYTSRTPKVAMAGYRDAVYGPNGLTAEDVENCAKWIK